MDDSIVGLPWYLHFRFRTNKKLPTEVQGKEWNRNEDQSVGIARYVRKNMVSMNVTFDNAVSWLFLAPSTL